MLDVNDHVAIDYLAQLDSTSASDQFALVRRWIDTCPLPFFKTLREWRPIVVTPLATLVTLYDDCIDVLNQPRVFTAALYKPKMDGYLMCHDDDALHTREKSIMQGLLNRNDLPQVRAMVQKLAAGLLDAAQGKMEAIDGFCRQVPAGVVQNYFGLDGVDSKELIEWSYWNQADAFYNQPFDLHTPEQSRHIIEQHKASSSKLAMYMAELMARKLVRVKAEQLEHGVFWWWYALRKLLATLMGQPRRPLNDDILTRMLRSSYPHAVEFDLQRVAVNAGGLLVGAIETTSQAVAQVVQYLLDHPQWLERAQSSARLDDTTQFDAIVWEALRFVPISPYLFRQVAEDTVIGRGTAHATTVRSGGYVLIVTQSAMFDERVFPDPDAFNPGRNWYHQFHFGYGSHECLGRYVGAVMIPEMVRQVMLRPNLRAEGRIDYEGGHLPQRFPLAWSK